MAEVSCIECGRRPLPGERWSLRFAGLGEVAVYGAECDQREFGDERVTRVETESSKRSGQHRSTNHPTRVMGDFRGEVHHPRGRSAKTDGWTGYEE
jgi:hypothetical protein